MSDSENSNEELWEDNSVDSAGFSDISNSESSGTEDSDDVEARDEEEVYGIHVHEITFWSVISCWTFSLWSSEISW